MARADAWNRVTESRFGAMAGAKLDVAESSKPTQQNR
jgi:hypothetical protein